MGYQKDREQFLVDMEREGMPRRRARTILGLADRIQHAALLACNDEGAYRDRVPCPAENTASQGYSCLCRDLGLRPEDAPHGDVPRSEMWSAKAERDLQALLPPGFRAVFSGDPRGACVKLVVPSGRTDDWGQTGICVPTRE